MTQYYYERLQGWSEFVGYYKQKVNEAVDGAVFVEVGVWRGRSAIAMAEFIRESGKQIAFTAVDHFLGSAEHQGELASTGDNLYLNLLSHIDNAGVEEFVNILNMTSHEAAVSTEEASCDFVYIDASHDYDNVTADLNAWWPKIKPGGTMAGHDWEPGWPGVVSAVKQFAHENDLVIIDHGTTWIIEK